MGYKVLFVVVFGVFFMSAKNDKKLLIIGHRGASGREIENTLDSFEKAINFGVDMIELDVHVCKSGHLVVFHDETIDRLTGESGRIADLTLAQLRKLRLKKEAKIPTLEEVLQLVNKRCKVDIELKGAGTGKSTALMVRRFLKKGWLPEHFMVTSFNFYELNDFHDALSHIPIGIIFDRLPIDYTLFAQQFGAHSIFMNYTLLTPSMMERAKERGLIVFAWTVNKIMDAKKLVKLGVDGIVTAFPNKLVSR